MNLKTLLLTSLLLCSCTRLKTGDLIFVASSSDEGMDGAIASATASSASTPFIHVAIVEIDGDGTTWIIEATPKRGVDRHPLETFLRDNTDSSGLVPAMAAMRIKQPFDRKACVQRAKDLCGHPYDFTFLPDNGAWYCSELVYDCFLDRNGRHIFTAAPMNFLNDDGTCPEYWTELFGRLGIEVPQGIPGTNPQDMHSSPVLKYLYPAQTEIISLCRRK